MKPFFRTVVIACCALAALVALPAQADPYRGHGRSAYYNRHAGHGYSDFGGGFYAPLYWGGYRFAPGYWRPAYPAMGLGYVWGGHHDAFGLSLSLPLYFGSRYDPYPYPPPGYPTYRHVEAQPAARPSPVPACRQTREYTTDVKIGDQLLPAYGTACLQDDGSWKIISGPFIAEK